MSSDPEKYFGFTFGEITELYICWVSRVCGVTASSVELRHTNMKIGGKNMTRKLSEKIRCQLLKFTILYKMLFTAVISHTRPPKIFFSISKTTFWWTSIKCIHDNNGERSYWNHYFNVNMSEYPSCSFIFT